MKFLLLSGERRNLEIRNTPEEDYIRKRQLNADFEHWAKMTSWTFGEASMLFAGIDPKPMFIDFELTTKNSKHKSHLLAGITNSWPRFKKMQNDFDIFNRGVLDGTITSDVAAPVFWFVTARKLEIPVPTDLWDGFYSFRQRTEAYEKQLQAKAKEIEQQRQAFIGHSPQSDMQRYLIEVTEHEPEITTGKLLKRMRKELPDCINKIHVQDEKKVKTWEVEYTTDSGDEKRIDYAAFNSALNRAKDTHKGKS